MNVSLLLYGFVGGIIGSSVVLCVRVWRDRRRHDPWSKGRIISDAYQKEMRKLEDNE